MVFASICQFPKIFVGCCLKIYYKKFLNFFFIKLYLVVVLVIERYADLKIFLADAEIKNGCFLIENTEMFFLLLFVCTIASISKLRPEGKKR